MFIVIITQFNAVDPCYRMYGQRFIWSWTDRRLRRDFPGDLRKQRNSQSSFMTLHLRLGGVSIPPIMKWVYLSKMNTILLLLQRIQSSRAWLALYHLSPHHQQQSLESPDQKGNLGTNGLTKTKRPWWHLTTVAIHLNQDIADVFIVYGNMQTYFLERSNSLQMRRDQSSRITCNLI